MGKYVIACPREGCGRYIEASSGLFGTGLFAKKKVKCSCGEVIDLKSNKLSSRKCEHCGNIVVYDQSKSVKAKCPICHTPINTVEVQSKNVEFSCEECGIRISAPKTDENGNEVNYYACPICDHVNNVKEQVKLEKLKNDNRISIIKYEGDNSTFVWKHPLEDFYYGSQLIVHESQEAVFFRDGMALDLFGPGRYTIETQKLPILDKLYKLPADNEGIFHSEVYFINKTVQMGIKWGTPDKVRFIDPLTRVPLEIGASGELNLAVCDSRKLLVKLVGTMKGIAWNAEAKPKTISCEKCGETIFISTITTPTTFCPKCGHENVIEIEREGFTKSLQNSFRPMISNAVKSNLASVIKANDIDILEVDEKLDLISESLRQKVSFGFEDYGLTVPQLYVTSVVLPEDDPNFKRIRDLHTVALQTKTYQAEAAVEAVRREAELQKQTTETEIKRREAERRVIEAEAEVQAKRMEGLTEAEIMAAKGYSQKDVLQAEVQKAYAEGIGQMGSSINIGGGGGGGGSMMSDLMGLGVGMAAMSAITPQISNMMSGLNPNNNQPAPAEAPEAAPGRAAAPEPGPKENGWTCPECGEKNIVSKFCPECGAKKPEPKPPVKGWTCPECGEKNITSKFCPECGAKKPEEPKGWTCPECGAKDIMSKFCPDCGAKRPEEDKGWKCPDCGTENIKSKFCPECGKKKGE